MMWTLQQQIPDSEEWEDVETYETWDEATTGYLARSSETEATLRLTEVES